MSNVGTGVSQTPSKAENKEPVKFSGLNLSERPLGEVILVNGLLVVMAVLVGYFTWPKWWPF